VTADRTQGDTTAALVDDLVRRATEHQVEVIALTDEELAALEGLDSRHVAPFPWLNEHSPEQREIAAAAALRGLMARGIAVASELDGEHSRESDISVALPPDVHATLGMRRSAAWILLAEQRTEAAHRFRVLYGQRDEVVLDEMVSDGGLHVFSVLPAAMAADALVAFVDPAGVAHEDGPATRVLLTDLVQGVEPSFGGLDEARMVTVLGRVRLDDSGLPAEDRTSVYVLPDQVEMTAAVDSGDATELEVRTVSANTLRRALLSLVAPQKREGS
jgi:hypothetical protein